LVLAQRVGGRGRAIALIGLWVAFCLSIVLAGVLVGLSDPDGTWTGIGAVALALAGALLLCSGPWLAKLWFDRGP
jgi:hypothetical protein